MKVKRLSEVTRELREIISLLEDREFPVEIDYDPGLEGDSFMITVMKKDKLEFVDSKGIKWVRVDE